MVFIRRNIFRPALAAMLGIVGAVLRKIELNTVFNSVAGLASLGQPISIALALFSAAAVAAFIFLSLPLRKKTTGDGYLDVMGSDSQVLFILSLIAVCGIAAGSVLYYFENKAVTAVLLAAVGFMASLAVTYLSRPRSKSAEGDGNAAASAYFVIFVCLWMVLEYKARSADPVLLDYVYDFLALCSAAMAFYYKAGFAFLRKKPAQTLAYMQISLYFCIVAIPGANGIAQMLYFISFALLLLRDMLCLEGNLIDIE